MTSAFTGLPKASIGSLRVICVTGAAAACESGSFDLVESHVHDHTWRDLDGHTLNLGDSKTGGFFPLVPAGSLQCHVVRVGLALRRRTAPGPFRIGDLEIDRAKRRVTLAGRPVRLTATEYRLLHALLLDAGGATTFETLQRRVWGSGKGDAQAVRSAVTKLRRKLGDDDRNPRYILGKRGMGYRMPEPDGA